VRRLSAMTRLGPARCCASEPVSAMMTDDETMTYGWASTADGVSDAATMLGS
jgi:hypothetical protein